MIITKTEPFTAAEIEKLKMKDIIILGSLALDLKRAAIGFHRGSYTMADRFLEEAIKRKKEFRSYNAKPYLQQILEKIEKLKTQPKDELAENALMYSTLIQNFVLHNNPQEKQ